MMLDLENEPILLKWPVGTEESEAPKYASDWPTQAEQLPRSDSRSDRSLPDKTMDGAPDCGSIDYLLLAAQPEFSSISIAPINPYSRRFFVCWLLGLLAVGGGHFIHF